MSRQKPHTSPISILLLIASIIIIISLVRSAFEFQAARGRLVLKQDAVAQLEAQKRQLELQTQFVQDPEAVDVAIHDELNLARPGETVVIIDDAVRLQGEAKPSSQSQQTLPVYLQWWNLFIHPE